MANHTTGAQRYNNKMHKIFETAKVLNAKHDAGRSSHAEKKHGGEYSSCKSCHGGGSSSHEKALNKAN